MISDELKKLRAVVKTARNQRKEILSRLEKTNDNELIEVYNYQLLALTSRMIEEVIENKNFSLAEKVYWIEEFYK